MQSEQGRILVHKRQIIVNWDNDIMDAEVLFKPEEFKTFESVLATLEVAKLKILNMQRAAQVMQMQQAQAEAMQAAALAGKLRHGRA